MKGSCNESLFLYTHMIKFKHLIERLTGNEKTREEYVLKLSREIVNAFKSGTARFKTNFDYSRGDETTEVVVDIKFYKRPKQDIAFSIAAGYGVRVFYKNSNEDALEMTIEYNPKDFPRAMNAFVSEIKEVVEHEFEHVGQQNFEELYIVSNRYDQPLAYPEDSPQAPTHYLYLISNREVPAYVKGLVKRARTNKISFEQAVDAYYRDYVDTFKLYGTDWSAVRKIWMNWYNANKNELKSTDKR